MEHKHQQDLQQPPSHRTMQSESQMAAQNNQPQQPPPPPQKCPRCDSSNTKFCYYNNYSLSQPRYFCKACRRYWTHGGTLRNVPVGGGCRKSKRPKSSTTPASSSSGSQSSSPVIPSPGPNPGQVFKPLPPVMSSMGSNFYTSGSILSSLAAMQRPPAGINQGAAMNMGAGSSQYDAAMAVLQGVSLSSLKTQPPQQFQAQNQYFPSQQSMSIPSRPLTSWTQNFTSRGPATTSSTETAGFWSGATADGDNQAGSSFNPNYWPGNPPGFDPSP